MAGEISSAGVQIFYAPESTVDTCPSTGPLPSRDINQKIGASRRQLNGIGTNPLQLIVELLHKSSAQTQHRLRRIFMPMNRQRTPRLNGIQHPLTAVLRPVPQVHIHP